MPPGLYPGGMFCINSMHIWEITTRLGVEPKACVMVDYISGALGLGMRAIWRHNERWPRPAHIVPTATITHLRELPPLLRQWQGK